MGRHGKSSMSRKPEIPTIANMPDSDSANMLRQTTAEEEMDRRLTQLMEQTEDPRENESGPGREGTDQSNEGDAEQADQAEKRALERSAELKQQIVDMKKEINGLKDELSAAPQELTIGKQLQVLSSKLLFGGRAGAPEQNLLEVGKPISGMAKSAKDGLKAKRSVEVQTDKPEEEDTLATLRAEALSLQFKLKEYDLKIDEASMEIETLHSELHIMEVERDKNSA